MFKSLISFILISSSLGVILSPNIIYSILFLMVMFLASIILFLWLGASFIALVILIVYVGAISIFFLFIIMMLDLRKAEVYNTFYNHLPVGCFIGFLFFIELFYILTFVFEWYTPLILFIYDWNIVTFQWDNVQLLGSLLFNYYGYLLIIISEILLVSMIGAIILVYEEKPVEKTSLHDDETEKDDEIPIDNKKNKPVSFWKIK